MSPEQFENHEHKPTGFAEAQPLRSQEFPVENSVIGDIIFRNRRAIWSGKLTRQNTSFHIEIAEDRDDPIDARVTMFILRTPFGENIALRLDEGARKLIGDYNTYSMTDGELAAIKNLVENEVHERQ
jgi:hypothetical protein